MHLKFVWFLTTFTADLNFIVEFTFRRCRKAHIKPYRQSCSNAANAFMLALELLRLWLAKLYAPHIFSQVSHCHGYLIVLIRLNV